MEQMGNWGEKSGSSRMSRVLLYKTVRHISVNSAQQVQIECCHLVDRAEWNKNGEE